MKIKIIGFKVGLSRPTANITFNSQHKTETELGKKLIEVLKKSDFISIRRVKQK